MRANTALTEQVLQHGLGVASAHGLQALSIGDVARELDLTRRGLVAEFGDRECLQLAVLNCAAEHFLRDVVNAVPEHLHGEAKVTVLFEKWIRWGRSPELMRGCPFVHASAEAEDLPPKVRAKVKELLDGWTDILATAIEDAKHLNHFRTDLECEQFVFELYGLYLSHHFWHWSMSDKNAQDRTLKAYGRLLAASRP